MPIPSDREAVALFDVIKLASASLVGLAWQRMVVYKWLAPLEAGHHAEAIEWTSRVEATMRPRWKEVRHRLTRSWRYRGSIHHAVE